MKSATLLFSVAVAFVTFPACASGAAASKIERARQFRALVAKQDYDAARALMAEHPRRWWDAREGEGSPWKIGPDAGGPWKHWDEHFHSTPAVVRWTEGSDSATALIHESNDYYRLLERGTMTNELVYSFDGDGKIEGLVIRSVGERPQGRTAEFVAWAKKNDPREIGELMPDGEIDPRGDHAERFRRLANRWRRATGREPIESSASSPSAAHV